jgi:hypothetical protein
VLQNARFLNNITVLQNFLNGPCAVAGCITLTNLLNNNNVNISHNNVNISRVVAIDVLSGGDLIVFQQYKLPGRRDCRGIAIPSRSP